MSISPARDVIGRVRLDEEDLGRYAHETQMPLWLKCWLTLKKQKIRAGVVAFLGRMFESSHTLKCVYLCHQSVKQIFPSRIEGGFCGYRNLQMLSSYITAIWPEFNEELGGSIPTIFRIQDLIEQAWDKGYNTKGRTETGGIKGTRKFIGTPEVQAVLRSLGIPCSVQIFRNTPALTAADQLVQAIESYFQQDTVCLQSGKTWSTILPPIYLQRAGHSFTVVGYYKDHKDQAGLIVFDPRYESPKEFKEKP